MSSSVCTFTPKTNHPASFIEVDFNINNKTFHVYFKSNDGTLLHGNNETYIACTLLPCMRIGGGDIRCAGNVSEHFLSSMEPIQNLYRGWDPSLGKAQIIGAQP